MKLHEGEVVRAHPTGGPTLIRTAVPGGWLYESYAYVIQHGVAVDAKLTSTFVPDLRPDRFEAAVDAVLDELRGRRGFRQTWDGIDPDTRAEIRSALLVKIKELA